MDYETHTIWYVPFFAFLQDSGFPRLSVARTHSCVAFDVYTVGNASADFIDVAKNPKTITARTGIAIFERTFENIFQTSVD